MNVCTFVGKIIDDLKLEDEQNTKVLRFSMMVEQTRTVRGGRRISDKNVLWFEAWDSGAKTIFENCSRGDDLVVKTMARINNGTTVFRINEFKTMTARSTSL
jgi:single-stranded DNA-binding protein